MNSKKKIYNRALKWEIRSKLNAIGVVKPHQSLYIIKDILGDKSACDDENQKAILERLEMAINCGEDIMVDLRKNNGKTPRFEQFWEVSTSIQLFLR